jgi:SAM-dependent methyltransferase
MALAPARLRRGARRVVQRLEDVALEAEGRRGVLGPAHRRWSGNSAADNRERWDGWDWSRLGEEWTASEEWKQGLVDDVLLRLVPAGGTVLEIGPGGGRWTEVIAPRAQRTIVADVSTTVLALVAQRVSGVETVLSPGASLPGVADASVDAVWSFDVFVHVAPADQAGYLAEIARVLRPGAIAVIHHADGRNRGALPSRAGWRAPMTTRLFAALAARAGLTATDVLRTWSGGRHGLEAFGDAITVLHKGQPSAGGSIPLANG